MSEFTHNRPSKGLSRAMSDVISIDKVRDIYRDDGHVLKAAHGYPRSQSSATRETGMQLGFDRRSVIDVDNDYSGNQVVHDNMVYPNENDTIGVSSTRDRMGRRESASFGHMLSPDTNRPLVLTNSLSPLTPSPTRIIDNSNPQLLPYHNTELARSHTLAEIEQRKDAPQEFHIEVGVRLRPMSVSEISANETPCWAYDEANARIIESSRLPQHILSQLNSSQSIERVKYMDQYHVSLSSSSSPEDTFDFVYGPSCSTTVVYNTLVAPIVKSVFGGINGTIFTYGQTGSGKSYSIQGTEEEHGLIMLAVNDLFSQLQHADSSMEYLLRVSYCELYNEEIRDLLNPLSGTLKIATHPVTGPFVRGITEEIVMSPARVRELLELGETRRHIGSTHMNNRSSRSHCLFKLLLEARERPDPAAFGALPLYPENRQISSFLSPQSIAGGLTPRSPPNSVVCVSSLTLVDLAGSERVSKSQVEGLALKELGLINRSLLNLGLVINKLSTMASESSSNTAYANSHVPYRDSKLTHLLQTSLGGNARTAVLVTMSPSSGQFLESKNSLAFARRARTVVNRAHVNQVAEEAALVAQLKKEVARLRAAVLEQRGGLVLADGRIVPAESHIQQLREAHQAELLALERRSKEAEATAAALSNAFRGTSRMLYLLLHGLDDPSVAAGAFFLAAAAAAGRTSTDTALKLAADRDPLFASRLSAQIDQKTTSELTFWKCLSGESLFSFSSRLEALMGSSSYVSSTSISAMSTTATGPSEGGSPWGSMDSQHGFFAAAVPGSFPQRRRLDLDTAASSQAASQMINELSKQGNSIHENVRDDFVDTPNVHVSGSTIRKGGSFYSSSQHSSAGHISSMIRKASFRNSNSPSFAANSHLNIDHSHSYNSPTRLSLNVNMNMQLGQPIRVSSNVAFLGYNELESELFDLVTSIASTESARIARLLDSISTSLDVSDQEYADLIDLVVEDAEGELDDASSVPPPPYDSEESLMNQSLNQSFVGQMDVSRGGQTPPHSVRFNEIVDSKLTPSSMGMMPLTGSQLFLVASGVPLSQVQMQSPIARSFSMSPSWTEKKRNTPNLPLPSPSTSSSHSSLPSLSPVSSPSKSKSFGFSVHPSTNAGTASKATGRLAAAELGSPVQPSMSPQKSGVGSAADASSPARTLDGSPQRDPSPLGFLRTYLRLKAGHDALLPLAHASRALRLDLRARDAEKARLQQELEDLRIQGAREADDMRSKHKLEITQLQEQLKGLQGEISTQKSNILSQQEQLQSQQEQLEAQQQLLQSQQDELQSQRMQIDTQQREILIQQQKEKEIQQSLSATQELKAELERLLGTRTEELKNLQEKMQTEQSLRLALALENERNGNLLQESAVSLDNASVEISRLRSLLEENEVALRNADERFEAKKVDFEGLQRQLQQNLEEYEIERKQTSLNYETELSQLIEDHSLKWKALEDEHSLQLHKLQAEHSIVVENLNVELEKLKKEYESSTELLLQQHQSAIAALMAEKASVEADLLAQKLSGEEENARHLGRVEELASINSSLKEELQLLLEQQQQYKKLQEELQQQHKKVLQEQQQQHKKLQEEEQQQHKKLQEEFQHQLEDLQLKLQTSESRITSLTAEMSLQEEVWRGKLRGAEAEVAVLRLSESEATSLRAQTVTLRAQLEAASAAELRWITADRARQELLADAERRADLSVQAATKSSLRANQAETALEAVQGELTQVKKENATIKALLEADVARLLESQESLARAQTASAQLQEEVQASKRELSLKETVLQDERDKLAFTEKELQSTKSSLTSLRNSHEVALSELQQLRVQLDRTVTEQTLSDENLRSKLLQEQARSTEFDSRCAALQAQLLQVQDSLRESEIRCGSMLRRAESAELELAENRNILISLRPKVSEIEALLQEERETNLHLQAEAANSRVDTAALELQLKELQRKLAEQDLAHSSSLDSVTAKHNADVQAIISKHSAEMESLSSKHNSEIEALHSKQSKMQKVLEIQLKESQQELDRLHESLQRNKQVADESAAQFSLQRERLEAEVAAMERRHETLAAEKDALSRAHRQLQASFESQQGELLELQALSSNAATKRLADAERRDAAHSAQLKELLDSQQQHIAELMKANEEKLARISRAHKDEVMELEKSHEEAMAQLSLELSALKKSYSSETIDLRKSFAEEFESLRSNHSEEISELKRKHLDEMGHTKRSHQDEISALKQVHSGDLDELKRTHLDEVTSLTNTFNEKLSSLKSSFTDEISSLSSKHSDEVSHLKQRLISTNESLDSVTSELRDLQQDHNESVSTIHSLEESLRKLQAELAETEASLTRTSDNLRVSELEKENLRSRNAALSVSVERSAMELTQLQAVSAQRIESLEQSLSAVERRLQHQESRCNSLETDLEHARQEARQLARAAAQAQQAQQADAAKALHLHTSLLRTQGLADQLREDLAQARGAYRTVRAHLFAVENKLGAIVRDRARDRDWLVQQVLDLAGETKGIAFSLDQPSSLKHDEVSSDRRVENLDVNTSINSTIDKQAITSFGPFGNGFSDLLREEQQLDQDEITRRGTPLTSTSTSDNVNQLSWDDVAPVLLKRMHG